MKTEPHPARLGHHVFKSHVFQAPGSWRPASRSLPSDLPRPARRVCKKAWPRGGPNRGKNDGPVAKGWRSGSQTRATNANPSHPSRRKSHPPPRHGLSRFVTLCPVLFSRSHESRPQFIPSQGIGLSSLAIGHSTLHPTKFDSVRLNSTSFSNYPKTLFFP